MFSFCFLFDSAPQHAAASNIVMFFCTVAMIAQNLVVNHPSCPFPRAAAPQRVDHIKRQKQRQGTVVSIRQAAAGAEIP